MIEDSLTVGAVVAPGSPVVDHAVATLRGLNGLYLVSVQRGDMLLRAVPPEFLLEEGDVLHFTGLVECIGDVCVEHGLLPLTHEVEEQMYALAGGGAVRCGDGAGDGNGNGIGIGIGNGNGNGKGSGGGDGDCDGVTPIGGLTALRVRGTAGTASEAEGAVAGESAVGGEGGRGGEEDELSPARRLAREETDVLLSSSAKSIPVEVFKRTKSIGSELAAGSWSGH